MPIAPSSNLELKAKLPSLDDARRVAEQIATDRLPDQHQIDTYFHCQSGRLKLREINGERAELISYQRPDQAESKQSLYFVVPVTEPGMLKQALQTALGIRVVVDKQREIFLHHNVRIHLDVVQDLGTFLEFEAVLDSPKHVEEGRAVLRKLQESFQIANDDLLTASYSDMLQDR